MSLNASSCLRSFPSVGSWSSELPYWQPGPPCPLFKPFDGSMTATCLSNTTFYVIGNSIPRSMLYTLLEHLGGAHVTRLEQKEKCPSAEIDWDASTCHSQWAGVELKFLYLQYFNGFNYSSRGGFERYAINNSQLHWRGDTPQQLVDWKRGCGPERRGPSIFTEDGCSSSPSIVHCLKKFFENATSSDTLLWSLGHVYTQPAYHAYPLLFTEDIDTLQWMVDSVPAFLAALCESFPGTVFRFTMAQLFARRLVVKGDLGPRYEKVLWERFFGPPAPTNSSVSGPLAQAQAPRWPNASAKCAARVANFHTIDQGSINANRSGLYNDGIHFQGKLTHATLQQVLNALCPDAPLTPLGLLPGELVRGSASRTVFLVTSTPGRRGEPLLRAFPDFQTMQAMAGNASTGDLPRVRVVAEARLKEEVAIGEPLPRQHAKGGKRRA